MNISGIRTYAGFYDYNTIKQSEMRSQQIQEAKAATLGDSVSELESERELETVSSNPGTDNGAKEFAEKYQPDAAYEMKGADSDIHKLDIEKAISDMKKDEVLMQYQFFVSGKMALEGAKANNIQENFTL